MLETHIANILILHEWLASWQYFSHLSAICCLFKSPCKSPTCPRWKLYYFSFFVDHFPSPIIMQPLVVEVLCQDAHKDINSKPLHESTVSVQTLPSVMAECPAISSPEYNCTKFKSSDIGGCYTNHLVSQLSATPKWPATSRCLPIMTLPTPNLKSSASWETWTMNVQSFPHCHQWMGYFMAILWVDFYQLEELHPGRPQHWPFIQDFS